MRVFITGGTGFIGRHVMEQLQASGHEILASTLEKDKTENGSSSIFWLYCDLANFENIKVEIKSFNPEAVIHLAWQGIPDYSETISRINLNNSIDLIDFILNNTTCKKILVSGSCWEYGKKHGACKESDPVNIDSYFTWAKHSLNQYLSVKCAKNNVTVNWFRIFYVYGPGQREGSLIPMLINSIQASATPPINTPMNKNDFIYVGDVARTFAKAVDLEIPSGVYNLGSGTTTSVYDICRIVEKNLLESSSISTKVLDNGNQIEGEKFWADMRKTNDKLDLVLDTSIEKGITKMLHQNNIQGLYK